LKVPSRKNPVPAISKAVVRADAVRYLGSFFCLRITSSAVSFSQRKLRTKKPRMLNGGDVRGLVAALSPCDAPSAPVHEAGKREARYLSQLADVRSVSERA
jgi:hypothetical protein